MRACIIIPILKFFFENKAFNIEKVNRRLFGGFCSCGGIMSQIGWIKNEIMLSECDKCWKIEAFRFNGKKFIERFEVEVERLRDFLNRILTLSEFEALENKAKNRDYNYSAYSRAKKKLEEMNFNVDEILSFL